MLCRAGFSTNCLSSVRQSKLPWGKPVSVTGCRGAVASKPAGCSWPTSERWVTTWRWSTNMRRNWRWTRSRGLGTALTTEEPLRTLFGAPPGPSSFTWRTHRITASRTRAWGIRAQRGGSVWRVIKTCPSGRERAAAGCATNAASEWWRSASRLSAAATASFTGAAQWNVKNARKLLLNITVYEKKMGGSHIIKQSAGIVRAGTDWHFSHRLLLNNNYYSVSQECHMYNFNYHITWNLLMHFILLIGFCISVILHACSPFMCCGNIWPDLCCLQNILYVFLIEKIT